MELEAQAEDFAAIVYAEPGALGLIANIVAALMIATENMLDPPFSAAAVTLSVAVVLCVCAVTVNFLLPPVLIAILLTLIFEAVGAWFAWGRRVAAAFEILIVLAGMYAVVVMMLKGVSQRYILPGFGNAPYDPLLMRTAGGPAPKNEKKKVTKYSEPMGMGFLGNVVPAVVMAFYHLGFFSDFRPAIAMFVFSAVCQVLASFYSFLRHDFYHATTFIIYAVYWNSRAVLQFLVSSNFPEIMDSRVNFYGQWTLICLILVVVFVSATVNRVVFLYNLMFAVMAILSIDHIPVVAHGYTFGVCAVIVAVLSTYTGMSALENSIAEKNVMYIGAEVIHSDKLSAAIGAIFGTAPEYDDDDYLDLKIVDTTIFISSTIALMAHSATEATNNVRDYHEKTIAVLTVFDTNPRWMILVTSLLAAIVSLYAASAELINGALQRVVVPVGLPLIKEKERTENTAAPPCPLFTSRRSSALRQVARLLDQGCVVGVPTDTVYALAGSCKVPESIRKIYMVKGRPAEKPICLCLSNLDQLAEVNPPFSPLLWNFMRRCYPGGISCVVPKGEWLKNLGLGDSVDLVGTKDNICIRVPDSSVLAYLVSVSGPVALTSANPSGGEDSTHHDMVIDSLGEKLDGVVCDGTSNELVASTVVNCMKIDEGVISYFRVGCTPQEVVDAHFEAAKAEVNSQTATLNMNQKLS
ncbi:hypothetical protein EGW08_009666 [Elysia chlorotica]|uniref:Threonylcarbamoyl-AMP synthase n=1 Tax=Elysia chlorotica TaxID=188477 RepID=A0A433TLZ3_ELYCH|nr:hypothetical protein EGW08_009666 [Elysia chlorotica]